MPRPSNKRVNVDLSVRREVPSICLVTSYVMCARNIVLEHPLTVTKGEEREHFLKL